MNKIQVNCETGEILLVEFTPEEIAALPVEIPPTYQELRAQAYPSFADQFDLLYHGGYDAWKAAIDAVKNTYPKV